MAFTSVDDFQTVLNACLTVRDSEMLTSANFWTHNNFWGSLAFFETFSDFLNRVLLTLIDLWKIYYVFIWTLRFDDESELILS